MERRDLSKEPLEKILFECAVLREFNGDIKTALKELYYFIGSDEYFKFKDKYGDIDLNDGTGAEKLRREGLLFYEFCLEYGERQKVE